MKSTKYKVIFEPFTQRHFIKSFAKKYKRAWGFTLEFLEKWKQTVKNNYPKYKDLL